MEKISSACAMEWSIELEKALRSKKPGRSMEAIQQIGARLQKWSREPEPTMAVHNIFGLVAGEDRLFANTILLRLADAFRLGDRATRVAVVRVFIVELRNRGRNKRNKRKQSQYKGILSKDRVHNHVELLKRVKLVYDTGDVESRALALILFGCWAHFAKDSAHIRYLILSSLVSSDILELKASLFAAGCFCELADDFASVVLEMLLNMVTSSDASLTIRLAGVRVFAKMGCSYSIADTAYKTGLKLVLDTSEEDFLVAMLISLSKLASRSTLLLFEQVGLLLSFLCQEKTLRLRATALRCLHFIFVGGIDQSYVTADVIKTLFGIINETELPSSMQCEALQILDKMLLYRLPNPPFDNMLEFTRISTIIENLIQSSMVSNSLLGIRVLVDVSTKLVGRTEMGSAGDSCSALPMRIISIIIDRIILLVKPLLDLCQTNTEVFQEVQSLLNILLFLVRQHLELGVLLLDKIRFLVEFLVDFLDSNIATKQAGFSVHEIMDFGEEKSMCISLKLVYDVHKFSVTCIENLNEVGGITTQILDKVKLLVECVHQCSFLDCYAHIIYSILLHSQTMWSCVVNQNKGAFILDRNLGNSFVNYLVEQEIFTLECAKKMLARRDKWPTYKVGTFSACQGAWATAAFIFEQLTSMAQSESCSCWLKSLAQFTQSESKIQLLLLPKLRSSLVDWSKMKEFPIMLFREVFDEIDQDAVENTTGLKYTELFVGAYYGLCSSRKTLESIVTSGKSFCFQKWFLALRMNVVGTVVDLLKVLGTFQLNEGNISNNGEAEKSTMVKSLNSLQQITQISFQFRKLAQEYDLFIMSFIGMDCRSLKIISALALSCSLLAFTSGFLLLILNLTAYEILRPCGLDNSKKYLQETLIQNLVGRLWLIDQETCSNLCLLLDVGGQPRDCFHLQPRNRILNIGAEVREILSVCNYAVSGIVGLQNEAKKVHKEESLSQVVRDGLQLLLNTITKWMHIPFRIPKYFFKLRPPVGSELFVFSADTRNPNMLSVLPGFHLSLNLCLRLRNLPLDLQVHLTKSYCILYSSPSFQEPITSGETKGQVQLDYGVWETDNMIQMNEKLLHYVTERTKKSCIGKRGRDKYIDNDDRIVNSFVCFELNDAGQGLSNCLFDVSHFPVGSYRIKWHSCCIDIRGCYWSLIPLNTGPVFTVQKPPVVG